MAPQDKEEGACKDGGGEVGEGVSVSGEGDDVLEQLPQEVEEECEHLVQVVVVVSGVSVLQIWNQRNHECQGGDFLIWTACLLKTQCVLVSSLPLTAIKLLQRSV